MELPGSRPCRQPSFPVREGEAELDDPEQVNIDAQRLVMEIGLALEGAKRTGHYTWELRVLFSFGQFLRFFDSLPLHFWRFSSSFQFLLPLNTTFNVPLPLLGNLSPTFGCRPTLPPNCAPRHHESPPPAFKDFRKIVSYWFVAILLSSSLNQTGKIDFFQKQKSAGANNMKNSRLNREKENIWRN